MTECIRSRRKFLGMIATGLIVPALPSSTSAAEDSPAETAVDEAAVRIVAKADEIRFPRDSFQTEIEVQNFSDGQAGEARKYRILSRGNENTIVLTLEPISERGQALLMRGRDLWIFMPSVSQPVRLSLAQRLTGQVSNGDLARANFSGDYTPALIGTEVLDGLNTHVLELTAVDRGVTYAKVKYWVGEKDNRPLRAEFFALSGRLLKSCRYEQFRELAGRVRPTRLVMEDALKKGETSILTYSNMVLQDLPERIFTREYLRRLG